MVLIYCCARSYSFPHHVFLHGTKFHGCSPQVRCVLGYCGGISFGFFMLIHTVFSNACCCCCRVLLFLLLLLLLFFFGLFFRYFLDARVRIIYVYTV